MDAPATTTGSSGPTGLKIAKDVWDIISNNPTKFQVIRFYGSWEMLDESSYGQMDGRTDGHE